MNKYLLAIIGVFLALCGMVYAFNASQPGSYDLNALLIGNGVLAILSAVTYFMVTGALKNENPNAFIRAKMGSTMMRFFLCVVLFIGYAYVHGKAGIKPTVFMFLGMYVIYSILESAVLSQKGKKKA